MSIIFQLFPTRTRCLFAISWWLSSWCPYIQRRQLMSLPSSLTSLNVTRASRSGPDAWLSPSEFHHPGSLWDYLLFLFNRMHELPLEKLKLFKTKVKQNYFCSENCQELFNSECWCNWIAKKFEGSCKGTHIGCQGFDPSVRIKPEVHSLNPVIGKILYIRAWFTVEKTIIKKKRLEWAIFKKSMDWADQKIFARKRQVDEGEADCFSVTRCWNKK